VVKESQTVLVFMCVCTRSEGELSSLPLQAAAQRQPAIATTRAAEGWRRDPCWHQRCPWAPAAGRSVPAFPGGLSSGAVLSPHFAHLSRRDRAGRGSRHRITESQNG